MSKYTDPTKYCWGVDISHYRPVVDYQLLKRAGCAFTLAKATESTYIKDGSFAAHVDAAYWADIPMGAYHFLDPQYYTQFPLNDKSRWPAPDKDLQFVNYVEALRHKKIYFQVLDVERWWVSYDEWHEWRRGQRSFENVRRIPPIWIIETTRFFAHRMVSTFPHLPLFIYSRNSFIKDFASYIDGNGNLVSLHDVISDFGSYPAYYPYTTTVVDIESWDQFWADYPPPDQLWFNDQWNSGPPWMGNKDWDFWQISGDKFVMPGIYDNLGNKKTTDINLYRGSKESLWERIGFEEGKLPPKPEPDTAIGTKRFLYTVKIRTAPSLTALDTGKRILTGSIVDFYEHDFADDHVWIRHDEGWSACATIGTSYAIDLA